VIGVAETRARRRRRPSGPRRAVRRGPRAPRAFFI